MRVIKNFFSSAKTELSRRANYSFATFFTGICVYIKLLPYDTEVCIFHL